MVKDDSRRYGHLDIVSFFSHFPYTIKTMKPIVLLSFVSLVACSSATKVDLTKKPELSKFDQVKLGVPASEVVRLLGEPPRTYKNENANYWAYKDITLKIDEHSKVAAKGLEVSDENLTLAAIENHYGVKDMELVKTVVGCHGPDEKLGADVYRSKELGAEIAVSFKGDIQRFVQNDELKVESADVSSTPVCRAKR